jgi:hypothetical protein
MPFIVLCISLLSLVLMIFIVDGQGYVPHDDCLRHCAKALSGKSWSEILILRPDYTSDHNLGWHKLLEVYSHLTGADFSGLMSFSIIFIFLSAVFFMPFLMSRPEAWVGALLFMSVMNFGDFYRLFYGRPYVWAIGGTLLLLQMWSSRPRVLEQGEFPSLSFGRDLFLRNWKKMVGSVVIIALMTYIHGSFYLYVIPVGIFLLAGRWKTFVMLIPCLVLGVLIGLLATGEPIEFVRTHLTQIDSVTKHDLAARYLVGELQPHAVLGGLVCPVLILLSIRYLRTRRLGVVLRDPVFLLMLVMGVLAHKNGRFWLDFGAPAYLLWVARELNDVFETQFNARSVRRLLLAGGLSLSFIVVASANIQDRWDNNFEGCERWFPKASDELLQGWFPEDGGIFYNTEMIFFYNTFAANPHADWKYALGYDPNIMSAENLSVFRALQKYRKFDSLQPWVDKMTLRDRLVLHTGKKPEIKELDWKECFPGLWFGRLKAEPTNAVAAFPFQIEEAFSESL